MRLAKRVDTAAPKLRRNDSPALRQVRATIGLVLLLALACQPGDGSEARLGRHHDELTFDPSGNILSSQKVGRLPYTFSVSPLDGSASAAIPLEVPPGRL